MEIINNVLENELYYNGELILTYKIEYPQIRNSMYRCGAKKFNEYNYYKAYELMEYSENELFKEAKQTYEYNNTNGYPVMVYEIVKDYNITYQSNHVISLYTDEYMFLGGAHGNTKREAQNWNLKSQKQIVLKELFPNNPYYLIDILKEINNQIKVQIENGSNQYFDNYCSLVQENLKLENFYIVKNGVEIFFNQYEIAPYSSGIPTFKIDK